MNIIVNLKCVFKCLNGWSVLALVLLFGASASRTALAEDLVIASSTSLSSQDPHITYDTLGYNMMGLVCGRLTRVAYDGKIELELADREYIEDDGYIIRYHLRPDNKFTDGSPVLASDISYSLHRSMSPELDSPGVGQFRIIQGVDAYLKGEATTISGIKVLSDDEIAFHLVRPSETLRFALATNFACTLKDTGQGYLGGELITAGPFMIVPPGPDEEMLLQSSPNVPRDWLRNVTRIRVITNVAHHEALAGVVTGMYDLLIDDATARSRISFDAQDPPAEVEQLLGTTYLALNTKLPPFDDLRVRQAVNHAVDRARVANLVGSGNTASSQILPPGLPSHIPGREPFTYDPDKARALMSDYGQEAPKNVQLLAIDTEANRALTARLASDLKDIGLSVTVALGTPARVLELAAAPDRGHIVLSEGLGWVVDYPYESSFFFPLHSEESISSTGWNWSQYHDPITEQMAQDADAMIGPEYEEERRAAWSAVFARIEENAHWVALYHRPVRSISSLRFGKKSVWQGTRIPYSSVPFLAPLATPNDDE